MRRSVIVCASAVTILVVASVVSVFFFLPTSQPPEEEAIVRYETVRQELEDILNVNGPRAALDRLTVIASSDKELASLCHGLSHEIGHSTQEILGFTGALAMQDDVCGSGYVHGVIEQELANHLDDFEDRLKTLCPPDDPRCFHGLGHGLMYVTQNHLPKSLQQCRAFSLTFQQIQCYEGAFMENFEADSVAHPSIYLYPDDPYRTCRDQPEPERGVCSFYFPRYFLRIHPAAFAELFLFCSTLDRQSVPACIKGGGSAAMKSFILEPNKALEICELVPQNQRHYCVEGLLSYMIVHYASIVSAGNFCDESLKPTWSNICAKSISEGARAYGE